VTVLVEPRPLGVGVIGAGWMGHVHARAYLRLPHHYPQLCIAPRVLAVADPVERNARDFSARYGVERVHPDWRELLEDPDVEVVSVTAPNVLHREIGVAVAEAGKHLWIEKPVGLTADDARAVADAVDKAGVQAVVGFNYRNAPAVEKARQLLTSGAIGRVTNAYVRLLTDYAAHPRGPLSWRYTLASGGHGVLGDLASHGIDLVRYLLGDLDSLVADTAVFHSARPVALAGGIGHQGAVEDPDARTGEVENEDYVAALLRTRAGVRVLFECSRVSVGDQNAYGFEVHGTEGRLAWDFRRPGELLVATGGYQDVATTTVYAAPGDGDFAAFQPGAGIAMSYDDLKVVECAALVKSIEGRSPQGATVADAVRSAEALEAVVESTASRSWVSLP
jgi:predicted dehydrogenase